MGGLTVMAQTSQPKQWTLIECIDYARQNNITIKREQLNADYQKNQLKTAKLDLAPSVNATTGYSVNFGRYVDQTTYEFTTEPSQYINGSVSAGVTLFQGMVKQNTIKERNLNFLAASESVKEIENNIELSLASYYLNVLFDKELLAVANEQYNLSNQQLERTQKLVDAGKVPMGSMLEIKAQSAKEALNVTKVENGLAMDLLNLAQILELQSVDSFDIVTPVLPEIDVLTISSANEVYGSAVNTMPEIKGAEYRLESANYQLKKAKGYLYPTLSANAGWGTNALKNKNIESFDLKNSLKDNANSYVGATLSIPIFNGSQARYGIKNSKISVMDYEYALNSKKLELRKEIQQAYADALAAHKKFISSKEAVNSYAESFAYTEKKFNVGMVTSIDYNTAKNELTRAQSDLLQAKYEYILRCKILDFYKGVPIQL